MTDEMIAYKKTLTNKNLKWNLNNILTREDSLRTRMKIEFN